MDTTRPFDSKRPWLANDTQLSYSHKTLLEPQQRRLSEAQVHYEPDNARRHSHTPLCDPYEPRNPAINPDASERPPLPNARPHTTGHLNECRPKPPPGNLRLQAMPPHDHPPQSQAHYIPPPLQLPPHPLSPEQYGYDMYDQNGEETQTLYAAEYTVVSRAQTKRTPRTSQARKACEACRNAKARCTDSKPCQGCVQKDIHCIYDPLPPKQTDRDILGRLEDKIDHLLKRQKSLEKALITLHPGVSTILEQSDEVTGGGEKKYEDEDFDSSVREGEMVDSDDGSESQVAGNVPPGEPAIPIGHTTGAAKILQWPAVVAMVGENIKKDRYRGIDPLRREIRRGVINLYGLGEGVQRSVGYEKDSMSDHSLDPSITSSETYSETAYSSSLKQQFSLSGGQSAVAESYFFMADSDARAAVDLTAIQASPTAPSNLGCHLCGPRRPPHRYDA